MWSVKKPKRKLNSRSYIRSITASIVVLAVIIAGVHLLVSTHAQSPYASTEAASGTLKGGASLESGNYVQFGFKPTSALAVHVAGDQLVNGKGTPILLHGVDASGTEYGCIDNDYLPWGAATGTLSQDETNAAAIASWKINAVRVFLNEDCWLNINDSGIKQAYVGNNYQTIIKNWVTALNNAGIYAIITLQWSAPGTTQATGQWPMADEDHSPLVWQQVATMFESDPAVIFDLFSEPSMGSVSPSSTDWLCWLNGCTTSSHSISYQVAGMQQLVNTVRATGANQPIMIGGLNWSGDPCGSHDFGGNGGTCMETANMPADPDNQLAISLHTYGPNDGPPGTTVCTTIVCWNTVASAAKAANLPIVTGEFGEEDCLTSYIDAYKNWADTNAILKVSYVLSFWDVFYSATDQYMCSVGVPTSNTDLLGDYTTGEPSCMPPEAGVDYKAYLLGENTSQISCLPPP